MSKRWIRASDLARNIRRLFAEGAADRTVVVKKPAADAPEQGASSAADPYANPGKFEPIPKFGEVPHQEASLATRTRPDLPSSADRHAEFVNAYHADDAKTTSIRRQGKGSLNVNFHGELASGHRYIAKPQSGIGHRELKRIDQNTLDALRNEAPHNGARHDAVYEIMSAMGAHHMVTPGTFSAMHAADRLAADDGHLEPDDHRRMAYASSHAGQPAHVQEFVPDAVDVAGIPKDKLAHVDAEHRLHGLVAHLLFSNQDGHAKNVLLHPSGHPVLIDHDQTLGSSQVLAKNSELGKEGFRSVFAPGDILDYRENRDKDEQGNPVLVGTEYPYRMRETLQRIAEGHYDGGISLPDADMAALKKNARELLSYGLEGVLGRRVDIGASIRQKAVDKNARLDAKRKMVKSRRR